MLAKKWMPRLPFDHADVLIIDEIGKNISGSGMDTNVVGRKFNDRKAADDEFPKVKRIFVRGLTEETHGNAAGIGIAEFCTRRCVEQIDYEITKINCLTGGHPSGAMTPVYYDTDREVLDAALSVIGLVPPHAGEDPVDSQHAAPGGSGVFGRLLEPGPRAGRLVRPVRAAGSGLRRRGQPGALRGRVGRPLNV